MQKGEKANKTKKRLVSAQHAKFIASSLLFFYVFGPSPSFLCLLEALHVCVFPPHELLYRLEAARFISANLMPSFNGLMLQSVAY